MDKLPHNGTKTHPLTVSALSALISLRKTALPRQNFNPGTANRLQREDLVEIVSLPSPYKTHKGKPIPFFQITQAGLDVLVREGI